MEATSELAHERLRNWRIGLPAAIGLLSALLAAVFPLFAWYGYSGHALTGVAASAVALGVCWFGACSALAVVRLAGSRQLAGLLGATFFRMGLPMVAGIWLHSQGGGLASAGVFGMIVIYYLISLPAETMLSLRLRVPVESSNKTD